MHINLSQPAMGFSLQKQKLKLRLKYHAAPATKSSTPTPASAAVFATAELLELILLHLEARDILISAQRVNRTWRDVISDSFRLQDVLCMRAAQSVPLAAFDIEVDLDGDQRQRTVHPLLRQAFGPLFRDGLDSTASRSSMRGPSQSYWMLGMQGLETLNLPIADAAGRHSRHKAFTRKGASWRRMQLSQPPIFTVGVIQQSAVNDCTTASTSPRSSAQRERRPSASSASSNSSAPLQATGSASMRHRILHFPEGLRMGEYYDLLDAIIWGASSQQSAHARDAHGRHFAWVSWHPEQTLHSLRERRELLAVQRIMAGWVNADDEEWEDGGAMGGGKVDIVIGEDATTPFLAGNCNFYNVRGDNDVRVQDEAWRYRCKEFKDLLGGL
jgi:hypothetical protein